MCDVPISFSSIALAADLLTASPSHSELTESLAAYDTEDSTELPKVLFDWFVTPLDTDMISDIIAHSLREPPPTPLLLRPTLLSFWLVTDAHTWAPASHYKLIYHAVCKTGLPNYLDPRIPVPSGLNIPVWRALLLDFLDTLLVDHLKFEWPLNYTANRIPTPTYKNHSVTVELDFLILKFINTSLSHNALLGPFESCPFSPWCQLSPMMMRPKKNLSSKCIIIDLCYLLRNSVNSGITKSFYLGLPFNFMVPSVSMLTDSLIKLSPNAWLWTADLARAYSS